jgi:hypothetical protein
MDEHSPRPTKQNTLIMHRLRLSVIIGCFASVLGTSAAFAEVAQNKARAVAANHGRRCYVKWQMVKLDVEHNL